jgi:hypothetical protein
MPLDRSIAAVASFAAPVMAPGAEAEGPLLRNSIDPESIGWDVAVQAAAVLLQPTTIDMAQDLAARLCAYNEIEHAVERMHAQLPLPLRKQ